MNKILIIARREYRAAVRTKGFLISLIVLPIMMLGGLVAIPLLEKQGNTDDKRIAVLDYSGEFGKVLQQAAEFRNQNELNDPETGKRVRSAYFIELVTPDREDPFGQKLALSDQVRSKNFHSFVQIGSALVHPKPGDEQSRIIYYAENSALDDARGWIQGVINNRIREVRVSELGLEPEQVQMLFSQVWAEGMGLVKRDTRTGEVQDAKKTNEMQTIMVPYILVLLMFMMLMMGAIPLLQSVMEEKSERIAEVLLGNVTPTEFMFGKILGNVGVSLTTSAIYIAGGIYMVNRMDMADLIPYDILPWFFVYMLLNIIMYGSIFASLGSTCNDSKDAQAIQFPAMLPVIIPMFVMVPIIMNPLSKLATVLSLVPFWTPMLMLLRQSTSVTIPMWQPIAGLIGVALFTILSVWIGGRVFRVAIMMHGKRPKFGALLRMVLKG